MIMETRFGKQQVKAALQQIIDERDHYEKELSIAEQAIQEFQFQIIEYDRLLADAHRQLSIHDPKRTSKISLPKHWIGTWQSSPEEFEALVCVEDAWLKGNLQAALNLMPGMLERIDLGHRHRVNAMLLYSAMISSSGANLMIALRYTEEALTLATRHRLHELAGKAQFHRGLCYFYLGEPAKAKWCFILASHLEDHVETVRDCQARVEEQLEALPIDDPKRSISSDFRFFCHSDTGIFAGQSFATNKPIYA